MISRLLYTRYEKSAFYYVSNKMSTTAHMEICYTSCGCNRTPFAADWGRNGLLAYGGCNSVVISQTKSPTQVLCTLAGHKDRVNSVRWIPKSQNAPETELVSASTDNTAVVWQKQDNGMYKAVAHLTGHTNSVSLALGVYVGDEDDPNIQSRTLVATASVDSTVKIWERTAPNGEFTCKQTISFGTGFSLALAWVVSPQNNVPILACAGDDQKIHLMAEQHNQFVAVQKLLGHEDWVRGLDFTVDDSGDILLASCGQDCYIRIWRLSSRDPDQVNTKSDIMNLTLDEDIQMRETTFSVKLKDDTLCYAVTLESVLQGHENWIYSVRWHPATVTDGISHQPMALLSASMDKTMILWRPDPDVWVDQVRVGEVGGNSLGFYGGMFSPDGQAILSHGYQGALQVWYQQQDTNTWLPGVTVGGHFASVNDIMWEPEGGDYLLSVSQDQTTRVHGYWKAEQQNESAWHELSRPQVHGYDMQCIALLDKWSFASGADEKVIRVFQAPRNFQENMNRLSGIQIDKTNTQEETSVPEGASVPSLGLSNKAVFQGLPQNATGDREIEASSNPQYKEAYFTPQILHAPPSEDNLLQNTLWPEVQKLYGHGYEIFTLAAHPKGTLLASACKANKPEHAAILLWDTSSWRQVCSLSSHSLTVTQMVFSRDGRYLLSVSRDRTWALYKQRHLEAGEAAPVYSRVAYSDKKTSVHSRIIWAAAWSHDDRFFITVSRDKKAVVWTEVPESGQNCCLGDHQACSTLDLPDSITTVDFSPVLTPDGRYILAFGLDNGCIYVYTWSSTDKSQDAWKQRVVLQQSEAHHLTVKRLQFRPKTGEVGTEKDDKDTSLQLASCGTDHSVRIYKLSVLTL